MVVLWLGHSANVTRRATSRQPDEGERGPRWLRVTVAELCAGAGTKAIGPHMLAPGNTGIVSKSVPQTQPQTLGDAQVHTPVTGCLCQHDWRVTPSNTVPSKTAGLETRGDVERAAHTTHVWGTAGSVLDVQMSERVRRPRGAPGSSAGAGAGARGTRTQRPPRAQERTWRAEALGGHPPPGPDVRGAAEARTALTWEESVFLWTFL